MKHNKNTLITCVLIATMTGCAFPKSIESLTNPSNELENGPQTNTENPYLKPIEQITVVTLEGRESGTVRLINCTKQLGKLVVDIIPDPKDGRQEANITVPADQNYCPEHLVRLPTGSYILVTSFDGEPQKQTTRLFISASEEIIKNY